LNGTANSKQGNINCIRTMNRQGLLPKFWKICLGGVFLLLCFGASLYNSTEMIESLDTFPTNRLLGKTSEESSSQRASIIYENDTRLRVTAPTPPLEKEDVLAMLPHQAQTIHHLVRQMAETNRYTPEDIARVLKAHRLAVALTGNWYRGQGRPLDAHLVGTASLAVMFGQPLQAVLVMMTHSLGLFAEIIQNGELVKPTPNVLAELIRSCGADYSEEAIDIVLNWRKTNLHSGDRVDKNILPSSSLAADMVILEAINYLDELLDLYLVGFRLAPSPVSYDCLDLIGAQSLTTAIEHSRRNIEIIYNNNPLIWKEVTENDILPGMKSSWRMNAASPGTFTSKSRKAMSVDRPYMTFPPLNHTSQIQPTPARKYTIDRINLL